MEDWLAYAIIGCVVFATFFSSKHWLEEKQRKLCLVVNTNGPLIRKAFVKALGNDATEKELMSGVMVTGIGRNDSDAERISLLKLQLQNSRDMLDKVYRMTLEGMKKQLEALIFP